MTDAARKLLNAFDPDWDEDMANILEAEKKQRRIRSGWRTIGWVCMFFAAIITAIYIFIIGSWLSLALYWACLLWTFGGYTVFANMEPHDPYSNDE